MSHLAWSQAPRCVAVWLLVTAGAALTVLWAAPDLHAEAWAEPGFDRLLPRLAAVALVLCALWAWVVTGIVVGQALAGRPDRPVPGVPRRLRALVLVGCGLAVVGTAVPAAADDHAATEHTAVARADHEAALDGLPLPDRAVGGLPAARAPVVAQRAPVGAESRIHVVRPGDTLWDLAAAELPADAASADVTARWHRIHALNRAVIGPDPDLIHPGQQLRMPPPPQGEEPS